MKIENHHITAAMHSCLEGYLDEIVDSISFSTGRELTGDEQQAIFVFVSEAIEKATEGTEPDGRAVDNGGS